MVGSKAPSLTLFISQLPEPLDPYCLVKYRIMGLCFAAHHIFMREGTFVYSLYCKEKYLALDYIAVSSILSVTLNCYCNKMYLGKCCRILHNVFQPMVNSHHCRYTLTHSPRSRHLCQCILLITKKITSQPLYILGEVTYFNPHHFWLFTTI